MSGGEALLMKIFHCGGNGRRLSKEEIVPTFVMQVQHSGEHLQNFSDFRRTATQVK